MTPSKSGRGLRLRSLIRDCGELELSLTSVPVEEPAADEVIIRVEAAPLNPSDLGLLFGPADLTTARASGSAEGTVVTAAIPAAAMPAMQGRPVRRASRGVFCRRRRRNLRQSPDLVEHGRRHAQGGAQGACAYGRGEQPRPDAGQALPEGRHRPGQYRSQQGTAGSAAWHGRRRSSSSISAWLSGSAAGCSPIICRSCTPVKERRYSPVFSRT